MPTLIEQNTKKKNLDKFLIWCKLIIYILYTPIIIKYIPKAKLTFTDGQATKKTDRITNNTWRVTLLVKKISNEIFKPATYVDKPHA